MWKHGAPSTPGKYFKIASNKVGENGLAFQRLCALGHPNVNLSLVKQGRRAPAAAKIKDNNFNVYK